MATRDYSTEPRWTMVPLRLRDGRRPCRQLGFWCPPEGETDEEEQDQLPHPSEWVDDDWDPRLRRRVSNYLKRCEVFRGFGGLSTCRLCRRGDRGYYNGSVEHTDGTFFWPEGLAHYVDDHGVRLPDDFVRHVEGRAKKKAKARARTTATKKRAAKSKPKSAAREKSRTKRRTSEQ